MKKCAQLARCGSAFMVLSVSAHLAENLKHVVAERAPRLHHDDQVEEYRAVLPEDLWRACGTVEGGARDTA